LLSDVSTTSVIGPGLSKGDGRRRKPEGLHCMLGEGPEAEKIGAARLVPPIKAIPSVHRGGNADA